MREVWASGWKHQQCASHTETHSKLESKHISVIQIANFYHYNCYTYTCIPAYAFTLFILLPQQVHAKSYTVYMLYRVCQKMTQLVFCQNLVKSPPNLIIFGIQIAKTIERCKIHSTSTSLRLYQRTTM